MAVDNNNTDFQSLLSGIKGTGVSVRKLLQSKASEQNANAPSGDLKVIGEMFVKAQEDVAKEQEKLSNKQLFGVLNQLDRRFTLYANNLSELSVMLDRFSDPNYAMNKEESRKMQQLLDTNSNIVGAINERAEGDATFRKQLETVQKEYDFMLRTKGIAEEEQVRVAQKNNQTVTDLWKTIDDNISTLSTDVMSDLKTDLIEGIGGPYVTMARQTLVPLMNQIRKSKVGQAIGDKLSTLGDSMKSLFIRDKTKVDADKAEEDIQLSDEIGAAVGEAVDNQTDELLVPDQSDIRQRALREERAKASIESKKSNKGVFRKIADDQEQTSVLLGDILNSMRTEVSALDDVQTEIAQSVVISEAMKDLDSQQTGEIIKSNETANDFLKELVTQEKISAAKTDMVDEFNRDMLDFNKVSEENTDDYRDADLYLKQQMVEKLDDVADKTGMNMGLFGATLTGIAGAVAALGTLGSKWLEGRLTETREQRKVQNITQKRLVESVGGEIQESYQKASEEQQRVIREEMQKLVSLGKAEEADVEKAVQDPEALKRMIVILENQRNLSDEQQQLLDTYRTIIEEQKKAVALAITQTLATGEVTDEGKAIVEVGDLIQSGLIRSTREIPELARLGGFALRGEFRGKGVQTIDIGEKSFAGPTIRGFEKGMNADFDAMIEEALQRKAQSISAESIQGHAVGGVFPDESLIRIAEEGPEAVVPLDRYNAMVQAPVDMATQGMDAMDREETKLAVAREKKRIAQQQQQAQGRQSMNTLTVSDNRKSLGDIPIISDNLGLLLINSGKIFT